MVAKIAIPEGTGGLAVGEGAVWAAVLHERDDNNKVRDRMVANGVISRPLPGNTMAFCPPLVITDAQVDQCVDALAAALS